MQQDSEFPRGCSLERPTGLKLVRRMLSHGPTSGMGEARWRKKYGEKESGIKGLFEAITRYYMVNQDSAPELENYLFGIDPVTQLRNQVLLGQGLSNIGHDRFVLATSCRIGMDATGKEALFSIGEHLSFKAKVELAMVTRVFEGEMVGVVLNTGLSVARLREGEEACITGLQVFSALRSLVDAQKAFIRVQENGSLGSVMTQQEFEVGSNWLVFSGPNR